MAPLGLLLALACVAPPSGGAPDGDPAPTDRPAADSPAADSPAADSPGAEPGRAPLHPEVPGGWPAATFAFAQARMNPDGQNDEWVALGWLELDTREQAPACGGWGPRVRRTALRWDHQGEQREGTCDEDVKDGVNFARWDHAGVVVDDCPGAGAWVEADGRPSARAFLFDCPAHLTAGFGDDAAATTWEGHALYDPEARTLTLRYEVNGRCVKEFYGALTHDAEGRLLAMRLDGERTGDTSSAQRGVGATHGYAYGSPAPRELAVPFDQTLDALRARPHLEDAWRMREGRGADALEHPRQDQVMGFTPVACGPSAAFDHSCSPAEGRDPFLPECADAASPRTAYLRFLIDPFPTLSPRQQLFWAWHAGHAPNWTGCYHRGSHVTPLLQVLDREGLPRGHVGVEIQRSAQTTGDGGVPEDAWRETDYKVLRWVEQGFEEVLP